MLKSDDLISFNVKKQKTLSLKEIYQNCNAWNF